MSWCQIWANSLGTMAWSRVYSVGIGLLKLSKLSGTSSWMGDHPATVQGLVPVVMLPEGKWFTGRESIIPCPMEVKWRQGKSAY